MEFAGANENQGTHAHTVGWHGGMRLDLVFPVFPDIHTVCVINKHQNSAVDLPD